MEPVSATRTLLSESQFTVTTDAACLVSGFEIEGGKLVGVAIGEPGHATEFDPGESVPWAAGEPLTLVVKPSEPGAKIVAKVRRSHPDAPATRGTELEEGEAGGDVGDRVHFTAAAGDLGGLPRYTAVAGAGDEGEDGEDDGLEEDDGGSEDDGGQGYGDGDGFERDLS